MMWAKLATEASRAITRGSPKRRPGARWPHAHWAGTTDSKVAGSVRHSVGRHNSSHD